MAVQPTIGSAVECPTHLAANLFGTANTPFLPALSLKHHLDGAGGAVGGGGEGFGGGV